MKSRKPKRLLAMFLSLCLVAGMLPMSVFAAETKTCSNHPVHDTACGYVEAVEGYACGHAHDEACGYSEGKEGVPCKHEQGEHDETCGYQEGAGEIPCDKGCSETGEDGAIVHAEDCAYTPAEEGAPCSHQQHDESCGYVDAVTGAECLHEHDAACGYIESVESHACGHTCELCYGTERTMLLSETREAAGSITGTVIRRGNYSAIPGITVTLWQKSGGQINSTTTDHEGKYAFTSLAPGEYDVKLGGEASDGFFYSEDSWSVTINNDNEDLEFWLERVNTSGTYSIFGNVKGAGTGFLNGIEVTLWQGDRQVDTYISDSRSDYCFSSLVPETYTVKTGGWFRGAYYVEQSQRVVISNGDQTCNFLLEHGNIEGTYSISGTVKNSLNIALGITVTLWQNNEQVGNYNTERNGSYTFTSLQPGEYTVKVGGEKYVEQSQAVIIANKNESHDFTLMPNNAPETYAIYGSIRELSSNEPLRVYAQLWQGESMIARCFSDSNGNYIFTSLQPGTYVVKADKRNSYAEKSEAVMITNGNQSCDLFLEPVGGYSVSGTVYDGRSPRDNPTQLKKIKVTLWQGDKQISETSTNGEGQYSLTFDYPGTYTVKAGGYDWEGIYFTIEESDSITVTADKRSEEDCNFYLSPGSAPGTYTVSGSVIQSLGVGAISGISVELWNNGAQVGVSETVSDNMGAVARFSFPNVSPGEYTLRIPAGTYGGTYYQECESTFNVVDSDITAIELRQEPGTAPVGYTVSGAIKNVTGGGLTGVPVQLLSEGVKMFEAATGTDGGFSFPNVDNGDYTLKVPAGVYAGTVYQDLMKSVTVNGQNLSVGDLELIAAAVPSAPVNFTVTPGLRQAVLSWTALANDGGSPVIKYQYSAAANGAENWQDIPGSNASTTSYTVTGLTGGTEYTFKVRAVNGVGAGAAATATATPTAPGPSAPLNFDYTCSNTVLNLFWKAPASNGGLPIVKYQYSIAEEGAPDDWRDIPDSNAGTTSYTVTGLTNLVTYTVKLRAVNGTTAGEEVSRTFEMLPSAPSVPRNLTATPGDGQMALTWEKPENDGGSPITYYQYRHNIDPNSSGAFIHWIRIPDSGPDTVSFTVTGLENGVERAFFVRAMSDYGMGDYAMVMATPQAAATVPTAPQNFQATPGDKQAALSWEAPQSTGGAEITGYEVSDDGGTTWREATSATGHTFENLTNGQSYTFQVRAINSAGKGTAAEATATPQATATVPGEPQNFQATPGNQQVTLSWTAPQSNGGVEITKYEVSSNNGTSWTDATGATSHTFTGLTNGQSYTFKVRAVNSVGNGTAVSTTATPQATATVPGEPQNFQVTPGNQQVALSWTAPQSNGGAEITKYEVSSNNGTRWTDATSATGHTFTGLTNGQSYTFKVRAVNSVGNGTEVSTTATPQAAATVPGEPQNFQATPGDQQVALSWTAPQSNGGAKITKYEVSKDDGTSWTDVTGATSHTFTGLTNDQSYTFKVRAVNSVGNSTAASTTATPQASAYRLTVINGRDITNSGPYREGAQVQIQADTPDTGKTFDRWTGGADNIFPSGRTSATTIITMPAGDVTVSANYKYKSGGGSSNDNNSSSDGNGSSYTAPATQNSYKAEGDKINQSVSPNDLKKLADSGKDLTLNCGKASLIFEPAALKAILAAVPNVEGNITFTAAPVDLSAFPDAAKLIGNRPVYDFTISCKDSMGNNVKANASFPAGSVSIALNYTPASTEVTGSLFIIYVDDKGAVTWLDKSSYNKGRMLSEVPHFSVYGVACKASAPVFTDITNHWAKADIEFVAARGLISGTGNNLYSPDGTMTRGMFVTALGRLASVSPDSYTTRSFTDVKADAYYAAYVEWAAQKQIANGTGDKLFSPDAPVTREQMAVIMANYAGQMGYSLPAPLAEVTFTDNSKISAWAAKEVAAMQRAGIIKGKDGGGFDPQASATRAEVSTVLRRFVEIVIDPATANGWIKNDSGHWLYYKDGKTLTGWQVIGNLRYYFNTDGVMHEGWKQDMDTKVWYYWTNDGAATGWRLIDGRWYCFYEDGRMAVSTRIDSYVIGPDGKWKEE